LIQFPKLGKKGKSLDGAIKGKRKAYSPMARDFIPYTVYDRYKLFPKATFKGPAIIEEKESTVIVGEEASVSVDDFGFLWIDISKTPEPAPLRRGQKSRSVLTRTKSKTSARGKSKR
jgi:N-methylhydantoinase A